jgi:hypothetical protein
LEKLLSNIMLFFENLNVPTELFGLAANGQGFAAGVELVFRPPTTAAD